MTEPRPPGEHPPFKLRSHRRLLLPDFSGLSLRRPRRTPTPKPVAEAPRPITPPIVAVPAAAPQVSPSRPVEVSASDGRRPMYWRLLRLRHVHPNGWLRALFVEGSVGLAVVLVLAEAASIWTIIALPVVVAVLVKLNDVIAGSVRRGH